MTGDNIYAYGVIEADEDDLEFEVDGVGGAERAYTISYRSLAAVVSDIDTTDPERTDEDVQAHDDVLQTVLTSDGGRTVVPMRYGMAFKNARTLKNVMRSGRRAFRKALRDVEGTVEVGVKIVADDESQDVESRVEEIAATLADASIAESENDLFSDRLVLNRSYLVDRDGREAFDDAVDEVREKNDDLHVRYSGPWAPYNFVDIEIGAEH